MNAMTQIPPRIRFYWDIGSTNTYFAFHLLTTLAAKYGATIDYVPFNLGFVFRHHNYALTDEPRAKMANRKADLMRWANKYDLPFAIPSEFPIKTSRALRGALAMRRSGLEEAYMAKLFTAYWENNDASIRDYPTLSKIAESLGVDGRAFCELAESDAVRSELIDITQEALDEGVFGAPTMVLEDEIYWGKDRFDFLEDHLVSLASG
jgi:2-hydroxychromene-2-carboxylate isomerase